MGSLDDEEDDADDDDADKLARRGEGRLNP